MEKRKTGRPAGSKDTKPRQYRRRLLASSVETGLHTVEDRVKALVYPVRVGVLAEISGLSKATIRKKIDQGKLYAFRRSGVILVEPKDFLEYWLEGKK